MFSWENNSQINLVGKKIPHLFWPPFTYQLGSRPVRVAETRLMRVAEIRLVQVAGVRLISIQKQHCFPLRILRPLGSPSSSLDTATCCG